MKMKKILFSILWAGIFAALTFIAEVVTYAVLAAIGFTSWKQSTVVLIGRSLYYLFFAMPLLGLILGLRGVLPGTRSRNPNPNT